MEELTNATTYKNYLFFLIGQLVSLLGSNINKTYLNLFNLIWFS